MRSSSVGEWRSPRPMASLCAFTAALGHQVPLLCRLPVPLHRLPARALRTPAPGPRLMRGHVQRGVDPGRWHQEPLGSATGASNNHNDVFPFVLLSFPLPPAALCTTFGERGLPRPVTSPCISPCVRWGGGGFWGQRSPQRPKTRATTAGHTFGTSDHRPAPPRRPPNPTGPRWRRAAMRRRTTAARPPPRMESCGVLVNSQAHVSTTKASSVVP